MSYQIMFYGGLAAFLLFLVITVFLFFYLRIADVIGNLSGITAKRNIRKIRNEGQSGKGKSPAQKDEFQNFDEIKTKRGKTTSRLVTKQDNNTTLLVQNKTGGFQKTIDIVFVHSEERI